MAIRKKFFEIEIPLLSKTLKILSTTKENLKGQTIKLDLTRALKGRSLEGTFKVRIDTEKPEGEVTKLILMPYYIRRSIRKSTDNIEDSFLANTQDGNILLKPFLITRKRVSRKVKTGLRNNSQKYLKEYCGDKKTDEIMGDILTGKLQKTLSLKLKKIYPLGFCEIRQAIVKEKTQIRKEIKPKEDKPEKEEKIDSKEDKPEKEEKKPKKEKEDKPEKEEKKEVKKKTTKKEEKK
ncbi:MAG: hypothetical protein KKF56_03625 [Nanoarchaeota archaeon]|nr:hypothetical protein [Nanoarchaeota archaeon]